MEKALVFVREPIESQDGVFMPRAILFFLTFFVFALVSVFLFNLLLKVGAWTDWRMAWLRWLGNTPKRDVFGLVMSMGCFVAMIVAVFSPFPKPLHVHLEEGLPIDSLSSRSAGLVSFALGGDVALPQELTVWSATWTPNAVGLYASNLTVSDVSGRVLKKWGFDALPESVRFVPWEGEPPVPPRSGLLVVYKASVPVPTAHVRLALAHAALAA